MTANVRYEMRVSPEFLEAVDDWRRRQPREISRSKAIQVLVAVAIIASDSPIGVGTTQHSLVKAH